MGKEKNDGEWSALELIKAYLKNEMGAYAGGSKKSAHAVCMDLLERIEKADFPPISTELTSWEKRCAQWMTPGLDTSDLSIEGAALIRTKAKIIREAAFKEFKAELPEWKKFANGYIGEPALTKHPDTGMLTIEYHGHWIYLDSLYEALPVED